MEGEPVGRDYGDRFDLVQVIWNLWLVLYAVGDEASGSSLKGRFAGDLVLAVPVVHAGSDFNYPAVGLRIAG